MFYQLPSESIHSCILKGAVNGFLHRSMAVKLMSYIIRILIGKSLLRTMTPNGFV